MLKAQFKKILGSDPGTGFSIDVDIAADKGITVLFGASGAGKTSILRAIAGIAAPDEGKISLDGITYFDSANGINLPIQKRRVGYVFQHHSLFPHMTAEENALYGAKPAGHSSVQERVRELFAMLAIEKTAARFPHELSGGEQQRIALARALVSDPRIMLLDEPLSAVDEATRSRLLREISDVQRQSAIPFIYVTHNHSEAIRLGDKMLVLDEGRILQEGTPVEIFNAPRSLPVARAVGTENVFMCTVINHKVEDGITSLMAGSCPIEAPYNGYPPGSCISVGIRSEDIIISCEKLLQTSARNVLEGTIKNILIETANAELIVSCGTDFKVSITPATVKALELEVGKKVYLLIKARAIHLLE